jgi:hypothetical protein
MSMALPLPELSLVPPPIPAVDSDSIFGFGSLIKPMIGKSLEGHQVTNFCGTSVYARSKLDVSRSAHAAWVECD